MLKASSPAGFLGGIKVLSVVGIYGYPPVNPVCQRRSFWLRFYQGTPLFAGRMFPANKGYPGHTEGASLGEPLRSWEKTADLSGAKVIKDIISQYYHYLVSTLDRNCLP